MSIWDVVGHIGQVMSIVEALAVLATAVLGFLTIGAWRKENLGKRKLEIAEQSLLGFYDLKQRFTNVRRRLDAPEGLSTVAAFEANRSHYYNRLGLLGSMAGETEPLLALRPLFQVYFGFEATEPFDRLLAAVGRVRGALTEVFTAVPANGNRFSPLPDLLLILGWADGLRPDQTDREVDLAVRDMERLCRPVLEGRR